MTELHTVEELETRLRQIGAERYHDMHREWRHRLEDHDGQEGGEGALDSGERAALKGCYAQWRWVVC